MTENPNNHTADDPTDHSDQTDTDHLAVDNPAEAPTPAAPGPVPPAASSGPRFRDRVFGVRAMVGVGLAGLVLGGLGGGAIGAVAGHDDRGDRGGRGERGGQQRDFDQRPGGGQQAPGSR